MDDWIGRIDGKMEDRHTLDRWIACEYSFQGQ